ncbi:alpha/beta fold hydrolase [Fulvivirga ligni]|uniref:alpha/beta fold hydrolase n=1 Tax=Fulvivirga ligni TaxID=2904246 RepID=UPI001F427444|nr:alpha/beta fold hydrolase [Fulvivirga ligni]UII23393.1 alpha/beta fold hydrolase [Fulvivirga ligni]
MRKIRIIGCVCFLILNTCVYAQKSHFAPSKDLKIHYQVLGIGEPVLIINGGPGFSSEGFLPLARKIASLGYQAILYDQRGTGKSSIQPLDSTTITMDLMNADIEAIRKHLGYEKWIVLGHSFGGIMAYYYTSKYPEKVKGMIQSSSGGIDLTLLSTSGILSRLTTWERDSLQYWNTRMSEHIAGAREHYYSYLARAYVLDKSHVAAVTERLLQGNLFLNGLVWQDLRRINYDCKEQLKNFQGPVLIIQGQQDVVSMELAEIAEGTLPNSEVVILPECGHYGWLDQEAKYFSAIASFLDTF